MQHEINASQPLQPKSQHEITSITLLFYKLTSPDGTVVMSSTNGLVGTGFVSRYWLQPRTGF